MSKEVETERYDEEDNDLEDVDVYFEEPDIEKHTLNLNARRRIEDLMEDRRMEAEAQDYLY